MITGEYRRVYSDGCTLRNCRITGPQPFCYCKNLRLINCTMQGCDFAFEYSDVEADIRGHIDSVKNPASGRINADSAGEIILKDAVTECLAEINIPSVTGGMG